jgi:cytosine/adenosine deaminase-related metal-dependent hydrolase
MSDASQLLIRGSVVVTGVPGEVPLRDAAVLVEAERIVGVGPWGAMRSAAPGARVLGGEGHWVLPAFVNAHYHNWRTLSMGATPDLPLEPFMLRASGFEVPSDLEAEFSRLNTLVSAIQLVRSGVALTIDMPLSSNHRPVLDAYRTLGLDVVYAPTLRTQNGFVYDDDARFLASLPVELRARVEGHGYGLTAGYTPLETYLDGWLALRAEYGATVQFALAPDGPEWCSETELRRLRAFASEHGACLHLHNSESPMEMQWALKTRGQTMTAFLAEIGFLGPDVSCGHAVWLSHEDVALLASAGATVAHCPSSNLRLSNGIAPVAAYRAAGLSVAVGTDGQGFSDTSDYLEELRLAGLLQRTPGLDTLALAPSALLEMATTAGARAFGRHDTGRLEAGAMANVVTLDAAALTHPYAWPGTDPLETLISRARASHVRTLVSRGRPLLEDGVVRSVDEAAVTARLQDLYGQIWGGRSAQRYANLEALEVHVRRFFEPWAELPVSPAYTYNRR